MASKDSQIMIEMGTATVYPSEEILSSPVCTECNNRFRCLQGEGLSLVVRSISHLFVPDYKDSWMLSVDLPDCQQLDKFFHMARICAELYTATRVHIEGRITESHIAKIVELNVVQI